jgi:chloramphenicol O-acetyltransferase type A
MTNDIAQRGHITGMPEFLNIETWSRRNQFRLFRDYDNPYFNVCADVDVTALLTYTRARKLSPFITYHYLSTKTANGIECFRYRFREGQVVIHDQVNASAIVLLADESFTFLVLPYTTDFAAFHANARSLIDATRSQPATFDARGAEDAIYHSVVPWVSFTSISHARNARHTNGAPRVTFGKFHERDGRVLMPLSVQVHHALMDGLHVGRFFERFEAYCSNPEQALRNRG